MPGSWSVRLQAALLFALLLGSSTPLVFRGFYLIGQPQRELDVRNQLREASRKMALAALPVAEGMASKDKLPAADAVVPKDKKDKKGKKDKKTKEEPFREQPANPGDELNRRLNIVSQAVLADFPGMEGGFYLAEGVDRFAGYAYPTAPSKHESGLLRTDPPPLEAPYIRLQAQQSLSLTDDEVLSAARDVGPSRVLVTTEPVGPARPARMTTWIMYRLTGPEHLETEVQQFRVAVGLAIGGILLSLILTLSLGRTLRRQWRDQAKLREELRRSEQLAALGKLLAGVAHEIRNPLAGIKSTVQLWQRLPETVHNPQSLEAIIQAVDRLNGIVGRLLYFARVDNAERQALSVNQVVGETLDLVEAQAAGQSVSIERHLEENLPTIMGSAHALRQVFLNLATNALQAMPRGGSLRCKTRFNSEKDAVEITFADTGRGISPEDRQHLFEPFFTTRPDGTGLGLALCREIISQHGGKIELETLAGPGTSFLVSLPVAK
jgi:two-component system, NtrC family, sensor histidine kinase HydH